MPFDLTISNQGTYPSCTGHALASLKQQLEFKERNNVILDGNWVYDEAKKIDGIPDFQGTYLRTVLKVGKNKGFKTLNQPGDPSIYRIGAYARIDNLTVDSLKDHIAVYGSVFAGFHLSNEGWQGTKVRPPKPGEKVYGHAVHLGGYTERDIKGQNSWGKKRHNKGIFDVPDGYLPFEAWVVLHDMPNQPLTVEQGGWVAGEYLTWINGKLLTTHRLNVREEPSTNSAILKTLPKGTQVHLMGNDVIHSQRYTWRKVQLL